LNIFPSVGFSKEFPLPLQATISTNIVHGAFWLQHLSRHKNFIPWCIASKAPFLDSDSDWCKSISQISITKPFTMKRNLYQEVTDTIIEMLSDHSISWDRPWVLLDEEGHTARNVFSSNRPYKGINQMLLSYIANKKSYPKNQWATFNQIRQNGGTIQKGEKSTCIYFWQFLYFGKNGKRIDPSKCEHLNPEELNTRGITKKSMLRYYNVFNIFQSIGLSDSFYEVKALEELNEFEKDEQAEQLINSTNATIYYKTSNRAFYNPTADTITLPLRGQFKGTEEFYETSLHELGHWTGHPKRLNRDLFNQSTKADYAKEELVAELTTAFLSVELGFTKAITNNSAYIKSWIQHLKNDNKFIFKASKQAEKAVGFIKGFSEVATE